jgi:hypothetical protein
MSVGLEIIKMALTFDFEGQVITEHHRFANLNNYIQLPIFLKLECTPP